MTLAPTTADSRKATMSSADPGNLKGLVYSQIQAAAAPVASALNMPHMIPVDEASLGDFPWFWKTGTNFNAATFNWLNSVFAYSKDGYAGTKGTALNTALFNVISDIRYVLDAGDNAKLNAAVLANSAVVNTLIDNWISAQGPIPPSYTTQATQLNYMIGLVLGWGVPGLTLGQLRGSLNPSGLLPNTPVGSDAIVSTLMTYLANTSSVANIQAAVITFNNELLQLKKNIVPQPALTSVAPGYMMTVDSNGATVVEVAIDIEESAANIQNNLIPAAGTGKSFSSAYTATKQSSNVVQLSAGGSVGTGDLGWFLSFSFGASASYNMFSADASLTECTVKLTYNGVTTVTPRYAAYNVGTGTGWWFPDPIEEAANPVADQSGYQFTPTPPYNFGVRGNFGAISRLMISQQPVISLIYHTSNYKAFKQIFQEQSHCSVSFLGIPIGGASQSYYQCNSTYDSNSSTVTVTMTPVGITTPITATSQLANVVGAQIVWPGASASQNRAGI